MAFKMKAGKEGPMKKNFGISPMKNYKKGYYGEGSSLKQVDESEMDPSSDAFFEPGGTYDTMTKKGYKWDGKQFVKK
tara:strand:+ start:87 stop:317 length:231 start_codon:yes stop_codon:yes gene_type:complete